MKKARECVKSKDVWLKRGFGRLTSRLWGGTDRTEGVDKKTSHTRSMGL